MNSKDIFRRHCIYRLKSKKNRYIIDKKINIMLHQILSLHKFKNISCYIPLDFEVNISSTIKLLKIKGKKILLPVMFKDGFFMSNYNLSSKLEKYGIKYNKYLKKELTIDIMIIPIVGFDKENRRIGFGKGMYDKFYSKLKYKPKVIFIQKFRCYINRSITDSYDIRGDYILYSGKKS